MPAEPRDATLGTAPPHYDHSHASAWVSGYNAALRAYGLDDEAQAEREALSDTERRLLRDRKPRCPACVRPVQPSVTGKGYVCLSCGVHFPSAPGLWHAIDAKGGDATACVAWQRERQRIAADPQGWEARRG
jgi:hypothetical protein